MSSYKYQYILIAFLIMTLSSCVTAPSLSPKPVSAGYLYEGSYINIHAPNSNGWFLVSSSQDGIEFARSGVEKGESFAAQVLMFSLPQTQSEQEFIAIIKEGFEFDTHSERFSEIVSKFQYSKERGYPCVTVSSVVEDRQAKTSVNRIEKLILQSNSLYCRHPVRQETGFAIIYSHRGKVRFSTLDAEAENFINGVQVP